MDNVYILNPRIMLIRSGFLDRGIFFLAIQKIKKKNIKKKKKAWEISELKLHKRKRVLKIC